MRGCGGEGGGCGGVWLGACGEGGKRRVRGEGCQRCLDACYLPRRGATTICTADNRGTNSTAPEYSAPATHHPGACCPGGAFASDSDMESGNGRVPAPWCRVTDQMSQAAARSHRSAAQGAANQYKYRAYWPAMQRRAAMASADRQMTGDATLRTNTPPATRPGAAPARRWTAASSLRRQGR